MGELFLAVLDMSLTGSAVIGVILLVRLCLRRAPKVFSYALWVVALLRLLCPVVPESPVGLIPAHPQYSAPQVTQYQPELPSATLTAPSAVQPEQAGSPDSPDLGRFTLGEPTTNPVGIRPGCTLNSAAWLSGLWLAGVLLMAAWGAVSWVRLRKRLVGAVKLAKGVYVADHVDAPFVLGLIRPRIYLPSALANPQQHHILLHERHHIRRGDHVFKLLAWLTLCLHWFNPLVWVAFLLAGRDMEMSCDEAVIRRLGPEVRTDYAASLLTLTTGKPIIGATPLAFGEGDTKGRIMNLAKWKKPGRWLVLLVGVVVAVLVVVLLTGPRTRPVCIRVDGQVYYQQSEKIPELPEDSTFLGTLRSIIHRTRELPEMDFSAINLDLTYAGCGIFCSESQEGTIYLQDYGGGYIPFVMPVVSEPTDGLWIPISTAGTAKLESTDLEPGMVFVPESCVYMNPLSSYAAVGGDSGMRYLLEKDGFVIEPRAVDAIRLETGTTTTPGGYPVLSWQWGEFPWSKKEWAEICEKSLFMGDFLRDSLDGARCIQVGNSEYLLTADQVLYLLDLSADRRVGTNIWSIYTLVPETAKGGAQWSFQPWSSAGRPGFYFRFEGLGQGEVSAVCTQSNLADFDRAGFNGNETDHGITIPTTRALYWIPSDTDGEMVEKAKISFTVHTEDGRIWNGAIYITGEEETDENGLPYYNYEAKLVGTGMALTQFSVGGRIAPYQDVE